MPAPQPPAHAELASTELTVLNLLRDRRDSGGSAASSAYLSSSRRSSGISPCFSSRRSSQASQGDGMIPSHHHRRLHNLSSTDSYDPISTDASRRSSEASQYGGGVVGGVGALSGGSCGSGGGVGYGGGGGSQGMLNLTPAQHYHLKAKYAAATGGPPPTPLPNMERMSLKTRIAMMDESGSNHSLPPLVRPPRCGEANDGYNNGFIGHAGYRRRVLYPGEGTLNGNRRASDPVRTQAPETFSLPPVQRFKSLNNLHPLPPLAHNSTAEYRSFSLQNYTRSEGNLQRGLQHSSNTGSIAENAALEALAMEDEGEAGLFLGDEYILPDDLVQYLNSQDQMGGGSHIQNEGQIESSHRDSSYPTVEAGVNGPFPGSHYLQPQQILERKSPSKLPIQWNEVSSGSVDRSPQRLQSQHTQYKRWPEPVTASTGRLRNTLVPQQVSVDFQSSCPQVNHSQSSSYVNIGVKSESLPNDCMEMRGTSMSNSSQSTNGALHQGLKQQMSNGPLKHSHFQQNNSRTMWQVGNNLMLTLASMDSPSNLSQGTAPDHNRPVHASYQTVNNYKNVVKTQQYLNPQLSEIHQNPSQPQQQQGSGDQCSLVCDVSALKLENLDHGNMGQTFSDCLIYGPADCNSSSFPALVEQSLLESMPPSEGPGSGNRNTNALPSPGTDLVSSTVDGHVPGVLDDGVNLDFGAMLEDGYDQGSLVSEVLSPSMFQGLSRTSSRLTTPQGSTTFNSVAPGLCNMAIGDMSSLLTTLAEESKFLAIMQ